MHIRCDIAFNTRLHLQKDILETLCVDIILPKTSPISIGVCYSHQRSAIFMNYLRVPVRKETFLLKMNVSCLVIFIRTCLANVRGAN